MEVVASRPTHHPLLRFSKSFSGYDNRIRRSSDSAASTTVQFCDHEGRCIERSPYKRAMLRISNNSALNTVSCMSRKRVGLTWQQCFQEEFNQSFFDCKLDKQKPFSRHTVVRSELAGTGIPDSAHPFSETKFGSKVRGICFYAVTAISAIFLIVVMLVQHPFVLLFDQYRRRAHHLIARIWATLTVSPFLKIEFEGLENLPPSGTPAVYVSNHQSFLDIYTLLTLNRSFKFISKTGIFVYPIIGWAMYMMGVIPLKRMDGRSQLECLKRCMELINKGASVCIFPEGTRSKDGKLGAFKKGAFSVAAKTRVPVVPMTVMGTGTIMPAGREGILNLGSVKVVIHKPIEGPDAVVLCNEARNTIAETLTRQG